MTDTKTNADNNEAPSGGAQLLSELRKLMPLRPLAYHEHLIVAERQASRLLSLLNQTEAGVSLGWLTDGSVAKITVVLTPRWRMEGLSGMTTWANGRWVIGINKGNPLARRRFTLAHEFKHALDANRDKMTYKQISADQRERVADYFSACYLMPKALVRRAWTNGIQDPESLAGLFKVSKQAMIKRLAYLQFIDDEPERPVSSYFRKATDFFDVNGSDTIGSAA